MPRRLAPAALALLAALGGAACDSAAHADDLQGVWVSSEADPARVAGAHFLEIDGLDVSRADLHQRAGETRCLNRGLPWMLAPSGDGFRVSPVGLYAYLQDGALYLSSDNEYLVFDRARESQVVTLRTTPPCDEAAASRTNDAAGPHGGAVAR